MTAVRAADRAEKGVAVESTTAESMAAAGAAVESLRTEHRPTAAWPNRADATTLLRTVIIHADSK